MIELSVFEFVCILFMAVLAGIMIGHSIWGS